MNQSDEEQDGPDSENRSAPSSTSEGSTSHPESADLRKKFRLPKNCRIVQSSKSGIKSSCPEALAPLYATPTLNAPVILYEGELELEFNNKRYTGPGSIHLAWLPSPDLRFEMVSPDAPLGIIQHEEPLLMKAGDRSVRVRVSRVAPKDGMHSSGVNIWGQVYPMEKGEGDMLSSVRFHVPNCLYYRGAAVRDPSSRRSWAGRAVMEANGWKVTLDSIEQVQFGMNELDQLTGGTGHVKLKKHILRDLELGAGFAITHVGEIRRSGGEAFNSSELGDLQSALAHLLSFCRGAWSAPVLPIGFDLNGVRIWEEWCARKVARWLRVRSWFNDSSSDGLELSFPGFIKRWKDQAWAEPIRMAIHWYVESNMCSGGVEGSIILQQAAFELLTWSLIVEELGILSVGGAQKLPASDKLRLLLSKCQIPLQIPDTLQDLVGDAKKNNWPDGPSALVECRNALVHCNTKKQSMLGDLSPQSRQQAWELGLWYLELILLWLFDYRGAYSNRLSAAQWKGDEVEQVPWAQVLEKTAER